MMSPLIGASYSFSDRDMNKEINLKALNLIKDLDENSKEKKKQKQ